MGDGRLRRAVEFSKVLPIRYGEEHCKVALLLSALLIVPLRDFIAMWMVPYVPLTVARAVGYGLLGTVYFLFFIIPFFGRLTLKKDMILLGVIILAEILFFGIRRPEEINSVYWGLMAKSILMAFPYYIVARNLKDYGLLEHSFYSVSWVINLLMIVAVRQRVAVDGGYSMGAAYAVLPGAIIAFRMLFRNFSFWMMLNAGLSLGVIALSGARGPLVCYVLFCIYEMIFNREMAKNAVKKIMTLCVIIVVSIGSLAYAVNEVPGFAEEVKGHGMSPRIFQAFTERHLLSENTRRPIQLAALETIYEHPVMGVGLLEDRMQIFRRVDFLAQLHGGQGSYVGSYSHFVFLDWLLEYGIIMGTFISLFALVGIYKIFSMPRGVYRSCLEIFFFAGCVPLLFSRIWHENALFFIVLGMMVSIFKDRPIICRRQ